MKIINCKGHMIKILRRHIDSFYDYLEKLKSKDSLSTNGKRSIVSTFKISIHLS